MGPPHLRAWRNAPGGTDCLAGSEARLSDQVAAVAVPYLSEARPLGHYGSSNKADDR